jgi:transcriptional regulator GlxA family with amidase domain
MADPKQSPLDILVLVTPSFNLAATSAFIDPFRAANYLEGRTCFRWTIAALAGTSCLASNGLQLGTRSLASIKSRPYDVVVVSASWTPEAARTPQLLAALRRWARAGSMIGGLDTGAFILADAGLLEGMRATVHYEHIDSFRELHPGIEVSEDLFVFGGKRFTCAGGIAASDMALHIIRAHAGDAMANAAARYIFHPGLRAAGTPQNPATSEPLGSHVPESVRRAIQLMEQHLENAVPIATLAARTGLSHRQLDRLFRQFTSASRPSIYYRDIRLDRARSLDHPDRRCPCPRFRMASGFLQPQVHFSRAYKAALRLGRPATDRVEGRIPFEFRAWPMHRSESARLRRKHAHWFVQK